MENVKTWIPLLALMFLQGCAFTKASLIVSHDPQVKVVGPISELAALKFESPDLTDARLDKARIGWKKNGYGQNTADITTTAPVDVIVEKAIAKVLTDNHHSVGSDGRVQIKGTVDRFWFDIDVNFWTVKFIGDVQCSLEFVDAVNSSLVYKSTYVGNYSVEKAGGLEKTWAMVMSKAVDKLIESIALDEELAKALGKLQ